MVKMTALSHKFQKTRFTVHLSKMSTYYSGMTAEEKFAKTICFIEGHATDIVNRYTNNPRYTFIHVFDEELRIIGYIKNDKDLPISVTFEWCIINNQWVCFYLSTGNYTDWAKIETYINTKYPRTMNDGESWAMTNGPNFHLCLCEVDRANKREKLIHANFAQTLY